MGRRQGRARPVEQVVGYSLRTIEVRFEMERTLGAGSGDDYLSRLVLPAPTGEDG